MSTNAPIDPKEFGLAVGLRLEAARLTLGMQRSEMAGLLGVSEGSYSGYWRYGVIPEVYKLSALVARGISSDYLFFGIKTALLHGLVASLEENEKIALENREKPPARGRPRLS